MEFGVIGVVEFAPANRGQDAGDGPIIQERGLHFCFCPALFEYEPAGDVFKASRIIFAPP